MNAAVAAIVDQVTSVTSSVLHSSASSDQLAINVETKIPRTSLTPALSRKEQQQAHGSTGGAASYGVPTPAASGKQYPVVPRLLMLIRGSDNQRPLAGVYGARRYQRRPTPQEYVPRSPPPLQLHEPAEERCLGTAAEWGLFSAAKRWPHHDLTYLTSRVVAAYNPTPNDGGDVVCAYVLPHALGRREPRARCDCCLASVHRGRPYRR